MSWEWCLAALLIGLNQLGHWYQRRIIVRSNEANMASNRELVEHIRDNNEFLEARLKAARMLSDAHRLGHVTRGGSA